jgi:ADP-ribosylglycohydrolase
MIPNSTPAIRADRIAGAIFGAAIGDALGAAFEFVANERIVRHLGCAWVRDFEPALHGSLLYPRDPGQPTDDTAMALSVAFAIASRKPLTAELFATRFLDDLDLERGRFGHMFWDGGPGGATTRALRRLRAGADPGTCGHPDDGGNGAAMRVHPVGCLPARGEVLRVAAIQARVTHGHPAAVAAAQAVAVLVFEGIAGVAPSAALPAGIDDEEFARAWYAAHADVVTNGDLPAHLRDVDMSGWATVAAAHAIALRYAGDPEMAIGAAAASGGDTDTIASIAGAMVGARCGRAALPKRWTTGMAPGTEELCNTASEALDAAWERA